MNSKYICPICDKEEEVPEEELSSSWALCKSHQTLCNEGYVALIEAQEPDNDSNKVLMSEVHKTGRVLHVKENVLSLIIEDVVDDPFVYINKQVYDLLLNMQQKQIQTIH